MTAPSRRLVALLFAGVLPAALAALDPLGLVAMVAWDAGILCLFWLDGRTARARGEVRVTRRRPPRLSLGSAHRVALEVHNLAELRMHVRLGQVQLALGPFERHTIEDTLTPTERGDLELDWVRGPLALAWQRRPGAPRETVAVAPGLRHLRRMRLASRRHDPSRLGLRRIRRDGQGDEFAKLREYGPDDELRRIDWKATARRDRPITKVYEAERSQNVVLALDCGRIMAGGSGGVSRMDRAVEGALVLARAALDMDDRVGLLMFSDRVLRWLPPRKGARQFRAILSALYDAEAGLTWADPREIVRTLRMRGARRSLICLFTELPDPIEAEALTTAVEVLGRRHLPLVVAPDDPAVRSLAEAFPDTPEDVWRRVAAGERLAERRRLAEGLRRAGALVVDDPPGAASLAAVNQYLSVKRRGRL